MLEYYACVWESVPQEQKDRINTVNRISSGEALEKMIKVAAKFGISPEEIKH